jgi:hypothetical protein
LIRLLDLGRYEAAAKLAGGRAAGLKAEVSAREQLILAEFADVTDETLANLVRESADAAERAEAAAKARAKADLAAGELPRSNAGKADIDRQGSTLTSVAEEVTKIGRRWIELGPQAGELRAESDRVKMACEAAEPGYRQALAELTAIRERVGNETELAQLEIACAAVSDAKQCHVGTLLLRYWRQQRQRLSSFVIKRGHIANCEDVRCSGH